MNDAAFTARNSALPAQGMLGSKRLKYHSRERTLTVERSSRRGGGHHNHLIVHRERNFAATRLSNCRDGTLSDG